MLTTIHTINTGRCEGVATRGNALVAADGKKPVNGTVIASRIIVVPENKKDPFL